MTIGRRHVPEQSGAPAHRGAFRFIGREAIFETTEALAWSRLTALLDLPREACTQTGPCFRLWRQDAKYNVQFGEVESSHAEFATLDGAIAALAGMIPFHLLPHQTAHVLHGGALLVNGQAHVFLGPGYIGKSTLAFHAWMHGCEVISDDYLILDPVTDSLQAVPKPLKLRMTGIRPPDDFINMVAPEHYLAAQIENAWVLLLSRALPRMTPTGRPIPIGRIHFLSRDGRKETFEHPVAKADAVKGIYEYLVVAPRNNLDVVRCLARLYERRAVSGLHVGDRDWSGALRRICAGVEAREGAVGSELPAN